MEVIKKGSYYRCNSEGLSSFTNGLIYKVLKVDSANNVHLKSDEDIVIQIYSKIFNEYFTSCEKEIMAKNEVDNVNHPAHYTQGGIECIDAMEVAYGIEAVIMFCMCNAFKYQWRFNKKNGREDILKCQWYQNKMVELQNKLIKENDKSINLCES